MTSPASIWRRKAWHGTIVNKKRSRTRVDGHGCVASRDLKGLGPRIGTTLKRNHWSPWIVVLLHLFAIRTLFSFDFLCVCKISATRTTESVWCDQRVSWCRESLHAQILSPKLTRSFDWSWGRWRRGKKWAVSRSRMQRLATCRY